MFVYMKTHKQLRPLGELEICLTSSLTFGGCNDPGATWEMTKEGYLLNPTSGQCMSVHKSGGKATLAMVSCSGSGDAANMVWKMHFRSEFQHAKAVGPLRHDKQPHELTQVI